ncbi:MAG: hypothetical protein LBP79_02070 [Clostridiales bacterium]|jgi:hypothetical protein|nr:hypothetical protein [Clostridiales bacterium]
MKRIIPVTILLFVILGTISFVFINPQADISPEDGLVYLQAAVAASKTEEAYSYKETRNWMTAYDKYYGMTGRNEDAYGLLFNGDGSKKYLDKFVFRVVNVYGDKENTGDYNFIKNADGSIQNFGAYIREEMSYGERSGSAATIGSENRTIYNKIIIVDGRAYRYYDPSAFADVNFFYPSALGNFRYTNPGFNNGNWDNYTKSKETVGSSQDYFKTDVSMLDGITLESVYGISAAVLSELELLSELGIDYFDFSIKEGAASANKDAKGKPVVTNLTFAVKEAYFDEFEAAFPGFTRGDSVFAGAEYFSVELVYGKVSVVMGYVRDFNPFLGLFPSDAEVYKLTVSYLGPKISKPADSDDWYKSLADQW